MEDPINTPPPTPPAPSSSEPLADIFSEVDPDKKVHSMPPTPPLPGVEKTQVDRMPTSEVVRSRLPLIIGLIVVGIAVVSVGAYMLFFRGAGDGDGELIEQENSEETLQEQEQVQEQPIVVPDNLPLDSDGDGLTDDEEISQYGTNPQSTDSDGDGLSDREEIFIYATDPLNPDTDADTFFDGDEVRNGYNPKGDGRLFDIPR